MWGSNLGFSNWKGEVGKQEPGVSSGAWARGAEVLQAGAGEGGVEGRRVNPS
jgi:hypothetical protein